MSKSEQKQVIFKKINAGGNNIRFRHKVGKKFVKFTIDQIRQQIRNAIKPAGVQIENVEELLKNELTYDDQQDVTTNGGKCLNDGDDGVGVLGWWNGPLGERKIGVLMNNVSLQLFALKRYGFVPDSLLENKKDWTLENRIQRYHYEEIGGSATDPRGRLTAKTIFTFTIYNILFRK